MPESEYTIQFLGVNKKNPKFGYIKTAEGTTIGCLAEQLKNLSTGQVYRLRTHTNQKGYEEFDAIITAPPIKQNTRPVTAPREARQIGVLSLAQRFEPIPVTSNYEEMKAHLKRVVLISREVYDELLAGTQQQARDDLQDEIGF